ncbi:MAG: hypothetical protein IPL63_16100 [Saprospiraceae bacterium]|nr:hypothetical protein [Saprospiraceae bacterium]MBK6564817.1 hypothetical protein [Saprospiraceae bacterium]MBK6782958.1 hypothetical protein [Saprospiraceae bacterium]MBK7523461.1 hypothetical protein [Saprospiraceae bacterium]MBK8371551.1 hypothetical protein [Saprospiraceae bacterium]
MLKNILKTLQDTGDLVKEKATELNESAKEKIMSGIEEWVEILPKLKTIGLEMTAFGISMSLSPCLNAELRGKAEDFTEEKLKELLELHKGDKLIKLFLNVIKTTVILHARSKADIREDIFVRLDVKLSPEIKVYIGQPHIM